MNRHHHTLTAHLTLTLALTLTLPLTAAPKKKGGGLADSIVPPPSKPVPRAELETGLKTHDRALLIANFWLRDPWITRGPDGTYYLTGTIPQNDETRAADDDPAPGVRVWRSQNLIDWGFFGKVYTPDLSKSDKKQVWAPELHWLGDRWALIHCPGANTRFLLGPIGEKQPIGPWTSPMPPATLGPKHDGSLYQDTNGTLWMIWNPKMQTYAVAPLNKTHTDWAAKPVEIVPAGKRTGKYSEETTSRMGHEGPGILKVPGSKKYLWFGTAWSTDVGRHGSYNLYYATSDKITGPYGPRRLIGRFLGHGNPFQDPDGNWWCTAFANANLPPIPREGIETRDLTDNAYTINQCGTTIVPLDVRLLPNGDIHMRAKDPAYATPGPDEAQKF